MKTASSSIVILAAAASLSAADPPRCMPAVARNEHFTQPYNDYSAIASNYVAPILNIEADRSERLRNVTFYVEGDNEDEYEDEEDKCHLICKHGENNKRGDVVRSNENKKKEEPPKIWTSYGSMDGREKPEQQEHVPPIERRYSDTFNILDELKWEYFQYTQEEQWISYCVNGLILVGSWVKYMALLEQTPIFDLD
ncbi:hypothetical protein ACHAWF_006434 [Thalassiosira exigua]